MPRLTFLRARNELATIGVTLTKPTRDEYVVRLRGDSLDNAYFTRDLQDAYDTGRAMAQAAVSKYTITAHRSAGSKLGAATSLLKERSTVQFNTYAEAEAMAEVLNHRSLSPHVRYEVTQEQPDAERLSLNDLIRETLRGYCGPHRPIAVIDYVQDPSSEQYIGAPDALHQYAVKAYVGRNEFTFLLVPNLIDSVEEVEFTSWPPTVRGR